MSALRRSPEAKQERSAATREALLDAAVEELLDVGYARLTTTAVAHRAGVSRGAQQHHFAHKDVLLVEAIVHLGERQTEQMRKRIAAAPRGSSRARHALDAIYDLYSGPLFGAMLELSLASRHEPRLAEFVAEQERQASSALHEQAGEIFAPEILAGSGFGARWAMAIATARGLAMLKILGHTPDATDRQWSFARRELLALLERTGGEARGR